MTGHLLARIGREPNPAERSLANALERPEVAEHKGRYLFEARAGGDWDALAPVERDAWIGVALSEMAAFARSYSPSDPDTPGGEHLPMHFEVA